MLNRVKKNLAKKRVKGQRIDLRNLHSELEFLSNVLREEETKLEQFKQIEQKNKELISEHQNNVKQVSKDIKDTKKQIKRIDKETKVFQKDLAALVEEIENKHEQIVELEQQLDQKQRQFGEVKSSYNLKTEEKTEAHDLYLVVKAEVDEIEKQIRELNSSIEKLVEEKENIKQEIALLEEKRNEFTKERNSKEDKNFILKEQYEKFLSKKRELERHVDFLLNVEEGSQSSFNKEYQRLNDLKYEVRQLTQKENSLKETLDSLNLKSEVIKRNINHVSKELEEGNSVLADLNEIIKIKSAEVEKLKINKADLDKQSELLAILRNDKEGEANKLSRELRELKDKVELQKSDLVDLEDRKSNIKKSHQQLALEISEYEEKCLKNDDKIKEARLRVNEQELTLKEKKAHLDSLKSTLDLISEEKVTKATIIAKWKSEIEQVDSDIHETKAQIDIEQAKLDKENVKFCELESQKAKLESKYNHLDQELKSKNIESKQIEVKSKCLEEKILEVNGEIDRKIRYLELVSRKIADKELSLIKLDEQLKSEQRKEVDFEQQIQLAKADKEKVESKFYTKQSELDHLQLENSKNKQELSELTDLKIKLLSKRTSLDTRLVQLFEEYKANDVELNDGKREVRTLRSEVDASEDQVIRVQQQVERLVYKREKQFSYLEELKTQKQQVEEALGDVSKAFSEVHDDYTNHLRSINAQKEVLGQLKLEKRNVEKRISEIKQEKESIINEQNGIQTKILSIRENNQLLLSQLNNKENALRSSAQLKEELVNEYKVLKQRENSLISKVGQIDSSLNKIQSEINEARTGAVKVKENIDNLQVKAGEYRVKVQAIEKEKRESVMEKHKIDSEYSQIQKLYHQFKEEYENKKSSLENIKEEIKKKISVVSKSDNLMPKLEKMINNISNQQLYLLRSTESLDKIKEQQSLMETNLSDFRKHLGVFSTNVNSFYFAVEKVEVLDHQLGQEGSSLAAKSYLENVLKANEIKTTINVQTLITSFETLETETDEILNSINASLDHFATGNEIVNKSESEFVKLKDEFENILDKYNASNSKFEGYYQKVRDIVATETAPGVKVNKEFFLTSLYGKASEMGIKLEIDESVIETIDQREFRILYKSLRLYSEVIREVNDAKTKLRLFRIKNFGAGHVVMRYDNFLNFDLMTVKDTLPILNKEIRNFFKDSPIKVGYKGHVDDTKAFSKLDIIIKHGDAKKKVKSKKTHLVRSRTGVTPALNAKRL